MHKPTTQI
jgi:hypothetical protein